MPMLIFRIRNGGFFIGPERWLIDCGGYFDFRLGVINRRIYKNSIDTHYTIPHIYFLLFAPVFGVIFIAALTLKLLFWSFHRFLRFFLRR
jgi:hypothetical protein